MNESELAILIRDMASEFIAKRKDPAKYVNQRYIGMSVAQLSAKMSQVEQRTEVAWRVFGLSQKIAEFIKQAEGEENGGT